jgi:hypothetical protein
MNFMRALRLRHLNLVSFFLLLAGAVSLIAGIVMPDGEFWQLVGLMLVLAGGVKLLVIFLWRQLAGLETDRHNPVPPT